MLSGQRATPCIQKVAGRIQVHHMEIDHGRFYRAMKLPHDVDIGAISATYRNGFLYVELPKKPS